MDCNGHLRTVRGLNKLERNVIARGIFKSSADRHHCGMYAASQPIDLTDEAREELTARSRVRSPRASDATRARLILLLADGVS